MAEPRTFICDVEPRGNGGWIIWINEQPYRGVQTDSALGSWERKRSGGGYTARRLVGTRRWRITARLAAVRAVAKAKRKAYTDAVEDARWAANRSRKAFQITSTKRSTRPVKEGNN